MSMSSLAEAQTSNRTAVERLYILEIIWQKEWEKLPQTMVCSTGYVCWWIGTLHEANMI